MSARVQRSRFGSGRVRLASAAVGPSPGERGVAVARMNIRRFEPDDEAAVVALWAVCDLTRPWNDPHKDIHRKLLVQAEMFLVGTVDHAVVATVMAGYEGHRGWINYLAVAPEHRSKGHARRLMAEVERMLRDAGCPKINLQIRRSNKEAIEFYKAIGFVDDHVIGLGKRLDKDGAVVG